MKFDFVIGNPPYQKKSENTSDAQIYNFFMDASYDISNKVMLITPAKFLYNAGKTPKTWNKKMLSDSHLKLEKLYEKSSDVFPGTTISGGVCITYRDATKVYEPIGLFGIDGTVVNIRNKVVCSADYVSIQSILFLQTKFNLEEVINDFPSLSSVIGTEKRIVSSAFNKIPELFSANRINDSYIKIWAKNREFKYINKKYLSAHPNTDKYKVILSAADGASGNIGTNGAVRLIGKLTLSNPGEGYSQTFIAMGNFDNKNENLNLEKYLKCKFTRFMVGTLKATNSLKQEIWANVPLQNFTNHSDIDWAQSIHDIDLQLYRKYALDDNEIEFIETHVKEMA